MQHDATHRTTRPLAMLRTGTDSLEETTVPAGTLVELYGTGDGGRHPTRWYVETIDGRYHGVGEPSAFEAVDAGEVAP